MSRIEYEYSRLEFILSYCGLDNSEGSANVPPALFIAWSPLSALMLCPQFAYLSHPTITFLRLPQPLNILQECYGRALGPSKTDPELLALCTPLGQWLWALEALRSAVASNNQKEAMIRLVELRRFATKHWPGWYEKVIGELRAIVNNAQALIAAVEILASYADDVAVLETCRPLLKWSEGEPKGNRISILEDALCYTNQGVCEIDVVAEAVNKDSWWVDMENDLAEVVSALGLVEQGGGRIEQLLGNRLTVMGQCLADIHKLEAMTTTLSSSEIHRSYEAVDTLLQTISDLREWRNRTRKLIHENQWEVLS